MGEGEQSGDRTGRAAAQGGGGDGGPAREGLGKCREAGNIDPSPEDERPLGCSGNGIEFIHT